MTLQQLKYVVKVAEKGNITEAAKELFISQPSLTNAVHELENEMQVTIFERTNTGVVVTRTGDEFLAYARQVLQQTDMLEERYKGKSEINPIFSVSAQHYSFVVSAFVDLIREFDSHSYDFTLRETQTYEIIEDVARMASEIGVLFISEENRSVIEHMLKTSQLEFSEIASAQSHVFISSSHPLADSKTLTLDDLLDYPYLSYEQGSHNSFYFSEEILSTITRRKKIKVRDRATLFNLVIGLNGYTVSSGIISHELNGESIIAKPLAAPDCAVMRIGVVTRKNSKLSRYGKRYVELLQKHTGSIPIDIV